MGKPPRTAREIYWRCEREALKWPQHWLAETLIAHATEGQDLASELSLRLRVAQLEQDMESLKQREEESPFTTFLASLGVDGLKLISPIPVCVSQDGDEYIASFFDANISTGGCSPQQAIGNLQTLVAELYIMHIETQDKLSPSMAKQKSVLNESICQTSQKTSQKM